MTGPHWTTPAGSCGGAAGAQGGCCRGQRRAAGALAIGPGAPRHGGPGIWIEEVANKTEVPTFPVPHLSAAASSDAFAPPSSPGLSRPGDCKFVVCCSGILAAVVPKRFVPGGIRSRARRPLSPALPAFSCRRMTTALMRVWGEREAPSDAQ